jgi:esterase/lipase superfamily enzyme
MLFISNRAFTQGLTPNVDQGRPFPTRQVNFDLSNNEAGQSIYFCRRNGGDNYTEIGSQAFLTALKDANYQEILLYIHGFDNPPEEATFPRAQELQRLCDTLKAQQVLVVPLLWPSKVGDSNKVQSYYDDQNAVDDSAAAYARLLQKFFEWRQLNSTFAAPCTKRINLLAHSMGNRLLRGTLELTVRRYAPQGVPLIFRNVFMTAADVVNECLEPGQEGQYIPHSARNVVVYYAGDDLAMRASKVANVGQQASRRLGHTGPEHMDKVGKNVYAVDCDEFNKDYDENGHGYFGADRSGNAGLMFRHLFQCIVTGRVPVKSGDGRSTILSNDWF